MSLIRRNNLNAMSLFDDLFTRDLWDWGLKNNSSTQTTLPAVNIRETNDHYIVEMAAPGMKKEDFKVELDGNWLTISSERNDQHEQKEGEKYTRQEFDYQSFQRSFELSKDVVEIDQINARYENGVLQLLIPKKEEVKQKPPRMIQIS
ncbi:MAG: Hsp20/alpha crystallin family protein [Candidatus Dadabacteria bacterium]